MVCTASDWFKDQRARALSRFNYVTVNDCTFTATNGTNSFFRCHAVEVFPTVYGIYSLPRSQPLVLVCRDCILECSSVMTASMRGGLGPKFACLRSVCGEDLLNIFLSIQHQS